MRLACVVDAHCRLGEGPCWDPAKGRLWWVDILAERLHWFEPEEARSGVVRPDAQVTALGLRRSGGLVAATAAGAGRLDPETGRFQRMFATPDEPAGNRSNDGNVGADGGFWFGTMDADGAADAGSVYRVGPDWRGERVLAGWGIPNTLRTSPQGDRLYLADSLTQRLFACALSSDGVSPPGPFADTVGEAATPDGSAIDAEGFVWNCQWDGWRIVRYAPDGRVDRIVETPVQRPTSCAFGGPDLATLFVTSARDGLTETQLRAQPLAGGLFAFEPGVAGAAPLYFEG